ncbi:hypothetical protein [Nocardioides donggukensis]|uniref:Uncharacterized protein n=1 Tax=Nocardioides donggukensis TaxID=2774019 RepID=A0A927K3F5_9ACTN|nr:hypothetical protein [Nocardioides donggukensis]MBD8869317.1 hypothetical protein [Nocardioides donggukensis]
MTAPLLPLADSFPATRLALHRVAAYVVSPARRHAMGRMGLRVAPGGLATPTFAGPDGMTTVGVEGVDLVVHSDSGRRHQPLTTLAAAGSLVGVEPDVAWAAGLDIPEPGPLDADLGVDADDAAALAAWFGFGWGILEALSMDDASTHASEPQLWPEHFDPAIEIGDPAGTSRASYGFSPGDVSRDAGPGPEPLPYVYVAPWHPDDRPDDAYWSAGRLAVLRYADLLTESDPAAAARAFLVRGRSLLAGGEG